VAAAQLCCCAAAPPSTPATGLGRLDAATPAAVVSYRRGNRDAGHLDVDASVGADQGDGWELKCIGGGGAGSYRQFGPAQPLFLLLSLAHLTFLLQRHTPVPLVPPRKLRRGYPTLKGEACLRFQTSFYRHQLMLATYAMRLNGLAGPLGLPLAY
jgi:hypothetical protein